MTTVSLDRRSRIVRLLETRDQHLPTIKPRRDVPAAGFVHDTLAPAVCPTCEGVDSHACTGCGGRGEIEARRSRDPYAVEKVQPYGMTPAKHEAARERDAQIGRLERQTREPWASPQDELADADAHPYGWETLRRRMYRDHDYAALDLAIDALRMVDDQAASLLVRVFEYQLLPEPYEGTVAARVLDDALRFVDELMPNYPDGEIRAPDADPPVKVAVLKVAPNAGRRAHLSRDEQARSMAETGASVTDICEATGLKKSRVYSIVNQHLKGDVA